MGSKVYGACDNNVGQGPASVPGNDSACFIKVTGITIQTEDGRCLSIFFGIG